MNIMNVGLSTLYDIGLNYSMKLNDREVLVYEDDKLRESKKPHAEKLQEEQEKKAKEVTQKRSADELSPDEERLIKDLQARDSEVKAHEAAHQAAGAGMTGAASYTYQQGPDGKMYAIGGEVSISMQTGSTPEETIANARKIVAAAMAPSNPSPQDNAVASSAKVMEMKAEQQLRKEQQEEVEGKKNYKNEAISKENENEISFEPFDISA